VKPTSDDAFETADGEQVDRYWRQYHQVLVTNYRHFVLVGCDRDGNKKQLEPFRLAAGEDEFWDLAAHPRKAGQQLGPRFTEFLKRVMLTRARLTEPKELASLLGAYAREARLRLGDGAALPALATLRKALEEALGLKFEGERGEHFFRSTLVQTLFYGVFSAWVLWSKQHDFMSAARFNWREAQWSLHVPMIRVLFEQIATPTQLPHSLVEVLDWAEAALDRVDRANFFSKFEEQHAVQYFYEPFLEASDPDLRKELGVWYTPLEVVRYMVARCDRVLREELGVEDGFADPSVYVLDPACGTGAYLVEVLKTIQKTYEAKGEGALAAQEVKKAALERVFGFEILPAPFVISHMQLGLLLRGLGAPLEEDTERAAVFLTNSLTGWEPPKGPKQHLVFPEMEAERDAAEKVKREAPILVVVGNPPYNGFAGVGMEEERALSDAYRTTERAPAPQGQGLNDLYVRFYRMGERKIVEHGGRGVLAFISNYSWLDGRSFTGMREHYLTAFDRIWIDCLNGDKYRTGKLTPEGLPDPSIFSTEFNAEGIQVGTAIALLVRTDHHKGVQQICFRNLWGRGKRDKLLSSASSFDASLYERLEPTLELGLPYIPRQYESEYLTWPALDDLFRSNYPGVQTKQDPLVIDIDRSRLLQRMSDYFDPNIPHDELARRHPGSMDGSDACEPVATREGLTRRGILLDHVVRYEYRAFDRRWIYWEPDTRLLGRKSADLFAQVFPGNLFLEARQRESTARFSRGMVTSVLADNFGNGFSNFFPKFVRDTCPQSSFSHASGPALQANVSAHAGFYAQAIGLHSGDLDRLFDHAVAVIHAPQYRDENSGALRQGWPRIPLPATSEPLQASARLGQQVAALLDTEAPVKGVTSGAVRPELKVIGVLSPSRLDPSEDLKITAGWGHGGKDGVTMPGKGKAVEREYEPCEREAIAEGAEALGLSFEEALAQLGETTFDIYLNDRAYWKNVPARVWDYTIGGYQVMKKWLSYRESKLLGRAITADEARELMNMARRIAAICLLQPALDANYAAVKANTYPWPPGQAPEG
jgi:hypothetical protein